MKRHALFAVLIALSMLWAAPSVKAEGWSLSDLLPTGAKSSTRSSSKKAQSPSLLTQLNRGAKRAVKGTQDTLSAVNPFASKKKSPAKSHSRSSAQAKSKPKKKSDSVLTSWLSPSEPAPPKTMGEFMRLKRLDP